MWPSEIIDRFARFKCDEALVSLNYFLAASKSPKINKQIFEVCRANFGLVTEYKIDFLAKWMILNSSDLAPDTLQWRHYVNFSELFNNAKDPLVNDPDFYSKDVMPFFVRILHQQTSLRNLLRCLGVAHLLFKEAAEKAKKSTRYDLPGKFQTITGMDFQQYAHFGMLFFSAKAAPTKAQGTLSDEWMQKYKSQCLERRIVVSDSKFLRFKQIITANYDEFRQLAKKSLYKVKDSKYLLYEFNPLKLKPIIQIGNGRYIAPNPNLVIERVTTGIYFDLLDVDHKKFTDAMGKTFEEYVGILLYSIFPLQNVFRERAYGRKNRKKRGEKGPADWVIRDNSSLIMIECKAFRPRLNVLTIADQTDLDDYARKAAEALQQLDNHRKAVDEGKPGLEPFRGVERFYLLVTYGWMPGINSPFFRERIDEKLKELNVELSGYYILSIEEFEFWLRLVERKVVSLKELVRKAITEDIFNIYTSYGEELKVSAIPEIIEKNGQEILNTI